ncbi:ISL3 family transposase [Arthrobacter sp. A5]|uniref:ISL3 family transposase n=1 Tax=Arthrobacter sp. A5 TaxID=576926 RepID=UPI003DA7D41F
MRATTLLNRLLNLTGVRVIDVDPGAFDAAGPLVVRVALKARKRLDCPHCSFFTMAGYDTRWAESSWRHLDVAGRVTVLTMLRRRLVCPAHGVVVQGVPFARPGSRFSTDFEDMIAWLVTRADKTTVSLFARIAWRRVGAICERVVAEQLDETRFESLVNIGVDEISWRKHHRYLTLVSDHATSKIVWGAPGKNAATLDGFFAEIGAENTAVIEAVSMDMGPAFAKSVRTNAPGAVICYDPFHVIQLATNALESFRRSIWQRARDLPDQDIAKKFKGTRWVLLKNPQNLTGKQQVTLAGLEQAGGLLWDAYQLKESLREVFAGDLNPADVMEMITTWCELAATPNIREFARAAATIRSHTDGIHAAVTRQLSNGPHEGLNNKIRTMTRRSYGFHTPEAALALIMLACGPVEIKLPYQK